MAQPIHPVPRTQAFGARSHIVTPPTVATGGPQSNFQTFTASLLLAGTVRSNTTKALSGVLSFTGNAFRATGHKLTAASLSFVGAIATARLKVLALAGSLSFSGQNLRQTKKTLVAKLLPGRHYATTILADSPDAYWRLDETSGTNAADQLGTHPGTYTGTFTLGQPGLLTTDTDKAVLLGGGKIPATGYQPFAANSQRTFECWARTSTGGLVAGAILFGGSSANAGPGPAQLYFDSLTGIGWYPRNTTGAIWGLWPGDNITLHVVVTYDDATQTAELFLNGVTQGPQATGSAYLLTTDDLVIGDVEAAGTAAPFLGTVDEFAVYSGILSVAQVLAHYNAGTVSSVNKATTKRLSAAGISFAGVLTTARLKLLALVASLSFSGRSIKTTGKALVASLSLSGRSIKSTGKGLVAKLLPTAGGYYGTVLTNNPISYWRLDESSGTIATDLVGGNSGTYTGTYTLSQGGALAGDSDTAVQFDGSTGYVALGDPASLQPAAVTVESWFKTTSTAGMVLARKRDGGYDLTVGGGDAGFGGAGQVAFAVYSSGSYRWVNSSGTYNDGNWHHAVGTFDGSTVRVYVDGQQVAFTNWSGTITYFTGGSAIGRAGDFSGAYFNGTIDEVAIYSSALTAAQVLAHYNAGVGSGLKKAITKALRAALSSAGSFVTARLLLLMLKAAVSLAGKTSQATKHGLAAALGFTGSVAKQTQRAFSASLSFAGNLVKRTGKSLLALLSFTGNILQATGHKLTTASLSFAGAITITRIKVLALVASLSFSGKNIKNPGKALSAGLSFTGSALKKSVVTALASALGFTGAVTKAIVHKAFLATLSFTGLLLQIRIKLLVFIAALSFSGKTLKADAKQLIGSLPFSGGLLKSISRSMTAGLSFTGNVLKSTSKRVVGILSFGGVLSTAATHAFTLALTATLSFAGATSRMTRLGLAAVLSFAGVLRKNLVRLFTAALSLSGKVNKQTASIKSGSISFIGRLPKSFVMLLSSALNLGGRMLKAITQKPSNAILTFTGNRTKAVGHAFAGALTFTGGIGKRIQQTLSAILSFAGNLNAHQISVLVFSAVLGLSGTLQARIIKTLLFVAHLAFSGAVKRNTSKALTAALLFASRYTRATTKLLTSASLAFTGALTKAKHHLYQLALAGSLRFTGVTRRAAHKLLLLVGGLRFAGRLQKGTHIALRAALAFHGFIRRNITHGMRSSLRFAGKVSKRSSIILRTVLRFTGRLPKSSATSFRATLRLGGQIRKATVKRFHPTLGFAGTIRQRLNKLLLFAAHLTFRGSIKRYTRKRLVAALNVSGAMNSFAKIKALILFAVSKLKVKFFDNAAMLIETVEYDHEPYVPPVHDVLVAPSHSTMLIDQIVYEMDDGQLVARTTQEQIVRSDHPDLTITEAG